VNDLAGSVVIGAYEDGKKAVERVLNGAAGLVGRLLGRTIEDIVFLRYRIAFGAFIIDDSWCSIPMTELHYQENISDKRN
ncbi:hypothetical protein NPIL_593511, partial [Nephila pilipes]